jgi:REP element-mobilizing transposase RayT
MEDAKKKFEPKLIQYTIMSNHVHLIVKAENYMWSGLYELKKGRLRLLDPPDEWLKLII